MKDNINNNNDILSWLLFPGEFRQRYATNMSLSLS